MKKKRLTKKEVNKSSTFLFIILILLITLGLFIYFKPKLTPTGFVVISEYENQTACEGAGYAWENLTEENCTTVVTCINETVICEPCLEYEDINGTQGDCINWSSCINETCSDEENCVEVVIGGQCVGDICDANHLNLCLDETECIGAGGYWYDDVCNTEEECVPDTCESLGDTCGSPDDRCGGTLDCGTCALGYSCVDGNCIEEETEETTEETQETQMPVTTQTIQTEQPTCTPNWQCGEWSECINETQVRTCNDVNNCGIEEGKPALSQTCTPPASCFDGIKNQDEKGIDCGGICEKRCPFFTIIGSAVKDLPSAGKEFFKEKVFVNKTRTFLIFGGIAAVILGFFAFKFFKRKSLQTREKQSELPKEKIETKEGTEDYTEKDEIKDYTEKDLNEEKSEES